MTSTVPPASRTQTDKLLEHLARNSFCRERQEQTAAIPHNVQESHRDSQTPKRRDWCKERASRIDGEGNGSTAKGRKPVHQASEFFEHLTAQSKTKGSLWSTKYPSSGTDTLLLPRLLRSLIESVLDYRLKQARKTGDFKLLQPKGVTRPLARRVMSFCGQSRMPSSWRSGVRFIPSLAKRGLKDFLDFAFIAVGRSKPESERAAGSVRGFIADVREGNREQ